MSAFYYYVVSIDYTQLVAAVWYDTAVMIGAGAGSWSAPRLVYTPSPQVLQFDLTRRVLIDEVTMVTLLPIPSL
jgi:hypothetical protein